MFQIVKNKTDVNNMRCVLFEQLKIKLQFLNLQDLKNTNFEICKDVCAVVFQNVQNRSFADLPKIIFGEICPTGRRPRSAAGTVGFHTADGPPRHALKSYCRSRDTAGVPLRRLMGPRPSQTLSIDVWSQRQHHGHA